MYKLSAYDVEDIGFALVKGPTHYCSNCGQMFAEEALQDVWSRGKGFYGNPYSFRAPLCSACATYLLKIEGSIKRVGGELQYKSIEELEDLFFLPEGGVCHA